METNKTAKIRRLSGARKGSGYVVKTQFGEGRTYHSEGLINDKFPVHVNELRLLVSREKLNIIGYVD